MTTITVNEGTNNAVIVNDVTHDVVVVQDTLLEHEIVQVTELPDTVVITQEKAPEQLLITHGGSVYRTAVEGGFVGTELEWITQIFDSKAGIVEVNQAFTDAELAWSLQFNNLSASLGDDISAVNTSLRLALTNTEQAIALELTQLTTDFEDSYATKTSVSTAIASSNLALSQEINTLAANVNDNYATTDSVTQAVATSTNAQTLALQTARSQIESGVSTQLTTFEQTLVDETQARVQMGQQLFADFTGGINAVITRIDNIEIDEDTATIVSELKGIIEDPTTGLGATYGIAQSAKTTSSNNATSITELMSGVTGTDVLADALLKLEAYKTEGGLGARAALQTVVETGGELRVSGAIVNDDGVSRTILFQGDKVIFSTGGVSRTGDDINNDITDAVDRANAASGQVTVLENNLGALAYEEIVETAQLGTTVISGGHLVTDLIEANFLSAKRFTAINGDYSVAIGGDNDKPIVITGAGGEEKFYYDASSDILWLSGTLGDNTIKSLSALSPDVLEQLLPTGGTGGISTLPHKNLITSTTTLVSLVNANSSPALITGSIHDSFYFKTGTPGYYTAPRWRIRVYRGASATGTAIYEVTYDGWVSNQAPGEPVFGTGYGINRSFEYRDTAHNTNSGDTLNYVIVTDLIYGDYNEPQLRGATVSVPLTGAGARALNQLNDVELVGPAANQVLKYVGGKWKNEDNNWNTIGGKPATATRWPSATEVTGLGTAATRDVGTSAGDMLEVGEFGLGGVTPDLPNFYPQSGFYSLHRRQDGQNPPSWVPAGSYTSYLALRSSTAILSHGLVFEVNRGKLFLTSDYPNNDNGIFSNPREVHHTGNILNTTGQSTQFPMTQKATTDALATKAASSHTHSGHDVKVLGNRLTVESDGKIIANSTNHRRAGMYGIYDYLRIGHIWSMGSQYQIHAAGTDFGNLYGLAYKYATGEMAGEHQMVWCQNGTPTSAMGTGMWTLGTMQASDFILTSDRRIKSDIRYIAIRSENDIFKLHGSTFYKKGEENRRQAGYIAQDVQKVLPEAVTEDGDGILRVSNTAVTGYLIEELKLERRQRIALEKRLEKLERSLH